MYINNRLGLTESTETLLAQEHRLNQISNNLANVDTSGYKKEDVTFWEMLFTANDKHDRVGKAMKILTDHQPGVLKETGNQLDFGLSGEAFFKVQTPQGVRYTRNGNFNRNGQGQLTTNDGFLVLGEGGPVVLSKEPVQVGRDGLLTQDGVQVGKLALAGFPTPTSLEKEGNSLFRIKDPATTQEGLAKGSEVHQGYLEASNVNSMTEMTEMIDLQRAYQAQQKIVQSIDETDTLAISRVGKLTT